MKLTPLTFLLAATLFAAIPLQAQVKSADSMIHRIFATLQTKNEAAFVALYPNASQFGRFMRNIMEQSLKSDEVRKMMEMDEKTKGINLDSLVEAQASSFSSPAAYEKMKAEYGKLFRQVIEKGEAKGVKWNDAKLSTFTMDSTAMGGEGVPFQPKGFKEAKGVIDFTVGNEAYQLAYSNVMFIESEGGWFGASFPQLARKGESLAPDADENSETTIVDTVYSERPVKKGKATKGKTATAKPKAGGAKSPARKPKTKG